MTDIDEKRVFDARSGATTLLVASDTGLVHVEVSDDIVGEFSLRRRGPIRDVAVDSSRLAVATDEDVLVNDDPTEFGAADAVAFDGNLLAAGDGRLAEYVDTWTSLAEIDDVRAIGGGLVAATGGVYRFDGRHAGLEDAYDVAAAGPLAATGSGVYRLGNGWMVELEGRATAVASDGTREHAVVDGSLYEHRDGSWTELERPIEEPIVDVAHGPATYAITATGTVLVDAGDGWRSRSLGVSGARALVVG